MEVVQSTAEDVPPSQAAALDERWLLARRIARSNAFTRSEQLSRLFLYVCRMHITGHDDEVNEQRIGIDVFRRRPGFDSGADSIVRSHATRLRQRLEVFFATEGQSEALRVEIPRGGYVPRFYVAEHDAPPVPAFLQSVGEVTPHPPELIAHPAEEMALPKDPATRWTGRAGLRILGLAAVILLAGAFLYFSRWLPRAAGDTSGARQSAVEKKFWTGLFSGSRTLVVTGDSGLVLYETLGRQDVSLSDYIAGNYHHADVPSDKGTLSLQNDLAARRYTSVADLNLAVRLSHLPQWDDQRAEVVFARDLRAADASRSNLILIGSRQANPWVSLIDSSMNFVLTPDGNGRYYFLNRHPLAGEQTAYRPSQSGSGTSDSSVYALICYRPGDPGMGKTLLVSGLWQSGTEAAGRYIMNDPHFVDFLSKIVRRDGSFPGFETLVQVHSVAGNAFTSSIVASRVQ